MSYSRWGMSCWYCYVGGPDGQNTFVLSGRGEWSADELNQSMEQILAELRADRFSRNPLSYHGEGEPPKDRFTEEEIEELKGYMSAFLEDEKLNKKLKNEGKILIEGYLFDFP